MEQEAIAIQSIEEVSSKVLKRLCDDEQFSTEASNLILSSCQKISMEDSKPNIAIHSFVPLVQSSKSLHKEFDKNFTKRSVTNDKAMFREFNPLKKSFHEIHHEIQKESIEAFEKEFNKRLVSTIGEKNAKRLVRNKKQHQLALFRWIFSLCTIASLPYIEDDSTKNTGPLFS
ncbi:MAG: hypothetical protein LBB16_02655 [Puniceicoccales bacterium]|jgi:hypothetical protein|nr:hypothetical protein [Puniceicoccales bacterium]